jgi:hypothetical protein
MAYAAAIGEKHRGWGGGDPSTAERQSIVKENRFHPHQAQHQIDLTPGADFMLLYTMSKNLSS